MTDREQPGTEGIRERMERAELARQRERIRARQYLEIANVMMVALDLEGRVTLANRKACQVLGHELHDLLGADWIDTCIPERERARVRGFFDDLVAQGELPPERVENLVLTRDGDERLIAWRNTVVWDDAGNVQETLSSGEDITDVRIAEEELRAREQELSGIYASVPVTLMLVDEERRVRRINPLGAAPLGAEPDELQGMRSGEALRCINHLDDPLGCGFGEACQACEVRRVLLSTLEERKPYCGIEATLDVNRKRGEKTVDLLLSTTPLVIMSEPLVLVSIQDISALKRTQQQLKNSEEKYQELFELALEAVFLIDNDTGTILEANSAASDMYGYSHEALLTMHNVELSVEEEKTRSATEAVPQTGSVVVPLRYHQRQDGTVFPVEITARFFDLKGRSVHVAAIRDLTARRSLEEQLRHAQKMESVGRLAGGVAHDFNNLLTVIMASAELMEEQLRPADPLMEDLRQIREAGSRAESLTRQLLAFSRRQVLQPRVLSLPDVVKNLDRMLRRLIGEDIALTTKTASQTWPVKADQGQLESVLVNLAVNARDAMPQGGNLTLETSNVTLDESYAGEHLGVEPGEYAMLAVSDTGIGMDAETRERVFEPFYTTKDKESGTGLGLAMVYGIVRQHGGFIWLYSELGRGSSFKIYLPRVHEGVQAAEQKRDAREIPHSRQGETVLVVEDEAPVRRLVTRILSRLKYEVLTARDGLEAETIATAHDGTIHLLLTDVIMPGRTGKETAEVLLKSRPGLKVLYMSGYTGDTIEHHGRLEPGTQLLQKPFSGEDIARRVRETLDAPAQRAE